MNISFRITIVLIMLFAIIAPRCHGAVQLLDDFAGLRKSVNQGPIWAPDPSRIFATPGGGGHPEGVAVSMPAPVAAKTSKPKAEVKPESKPEPKPEVKPEEKPTPPSIPTVKPPKDEPKQKCWPFKFRCKPVKKDRPTCKPEAKHDKKPSCRKADHKKSVCSKPSHPGKFGGHKGHGIGHSKGHCGKGAGHGHGRGR